MTKAMTGRERLLAAAHLQVPDRVPRFIWKEVAVERGLREHYGTHDLLHAMREDLASVYPQPSRLHHSYASYFGRPGVTWDEWGRGRLWDAEQHYAEYLYPLEHAETLDEILAYPWPDLDAGYRYEGLADQVSALHTAGYAVTGGLSETVFEIAWQLRSMDRLFADIIAGDEKAAAVLDRITDRRVATARAYARAGVDLVDLGDDVAMQTGLMMSRSMWTRWFRPRLERVICAIREVNPDILIWYHSDGKINDLVPDLIAAGVQILNPVQPECVDHAWIKAAYGNRLAFAGGLGVQSVLPFGTPDEVRAHVRDTIATLGASGGLIIGPSHVLERDVPLANILAMVEAMDEYGVYPGM